MSSNGFDPDQDEPSIRGVADASQNGFLGPSWPCPFCGGTRLKRSDSDYPDPLRIELYCDSSACEVREIVVLARRAGGREFRGDVQALYAIDQGTHDEQVADGYEFLHDANGNPTGRLFSMGSYPGPVEAARRTLERRQRRTIVTVKPDL